MTEEQETSVYTALEALVAEERRHKAEMARLRSSLLVNAKHFTSYLEMYTFIRAHTPSFEAFFADMRDARDIFDKEQRKKH